MTKELDETTYAPNSGDERAFLAKHIIKKIKYPLDTEDQFVANNVKKDRTKKASYEDGEDMLVYESIKSIKELLTQKLVDSLHEEDLVRTNRADKKASIVHAVDSKGNSKTYTKKAATGEITVGREKYESFNPLQEAAKLNKSNIVHFKDDAKSFAKDYVKAKKGDYQPLGSLDDDSHQNAVEKFYNTYNHQHVKSGFGGSGEELYTHKQTGEKFHVKKTPNGKGFDGTDHIISKLKEDLEYISERNQDNKLKKDISTTKLGNNADVGRNNFGSKELKPLSKYSSNHSSLKNAVAKMKRAGRAELKYGKDAGYIQTFNDFGKNVHEDYEQLDEISKSTLASYTNKAVNNLGNNAVELGRKRAEADDVDRFTNRHMKDKYALGDTLKKSIGADQSSQRVNLNKIINRTKGIERATRRLAKEDLDEAFHIGSLKLKDGSTVTLNQESVDNLNTLFNNLNGSNKKKMEEHLLSGKSGFKEILMFAKEAGE